MCEVVLNEFTSTEDPKNDGRLVSDSVRVPSCVDTPWKVKFVALEVPAFHSQPAVDSYSDIR